MSEVEYGIYEPRKGGWLKAAAGPTLGLLAPAVCSAAGLVVAVAIANSRAGGRPDDVVSITERLIGSAGFLLAVAMPSLLFVAAGGYLSARAAGSEETKRAIPVALAAALATVLIVLVAPVHVPILIAAALVAAPLPAALGGVAVRRVAARKTANREYEKTRRREMLAEPQFPRPPAREDEEASALAAQVAGALARQETPAPPPAQTPPLEQPFPRARAASAASPGKLEALDSLRAAVRAALLTHPAATEEDFERCWPAIRDEIFKQHTLRVYNSRAPRENGNRENGNR